MITRCSSGHRVRSAPMEDDMALRRHEPEPVVNVTVHVHLGENGLDSITTKLDQAISLLTSQGVTMTALSDAVTRVINDVVSDYDALKQKYLDALAADAADQATIDEQKAQLDQQSADQQAAIDALNAVDLDPSNPAPPDTGGDTGTGTDGTDTGGTTP